MFVRADKLLEEGSKKISLVERVCGNCKFYLRLDEEEGACELKKTVVSANKKACRNFKCEFLERLEECINSYLRVEHETAPQVRPLREVREITNIEIVNGELHVSYIDNYGNCWRRILKGEGWKRLFDEKEIERTSEVILTEKALEMSNRLYSVLAVLEEQVDGDLSSTAKRNLQEVRETLKLALKRIDAVFGVEEVV